VILDVPDTLWSSYEPTGSMEPVLSEKANGIYILPKGPEDIKVGDIVAYSKDDHSKDIVHRVVGVTRDEYGNTFYKLKGDANPVPDPELVPYNKVQRILVGVIY
jgi:signal peptidase I